LSQLEDPEGEIDLDAVGVEDPAVEFVGQSFANQQLIDFGTPARSLRNGAAPARPTTLAACALRKHSRKQIGCCLVPLSSGPDEFLSVGFTLRDPDRFL
jgi:hypothetical protein